MRKLLLLFSATFFTIHVWGQTQIDTSPIWHHNGNVGIGITNPKGKLNIHNNVQFNLESAYSSQDHIVLSASDPGDNGYFGGITWNSGERRRASIVATREHTDTDYVGIAFMTKGSDGPGPMYESMRITRNGNVGIGTESPSSNLHVDGNSRIATFGDDVYNDKYILIRNHEEHGIAFGLNDGISTDGSSGVALIRAGTNKGFAIATNNPTNFNSVTEVDFIIDGNGKVGIGTTNPNYLLSVKGTIGCGEVIVENVTGWADFVFEDDYNLMPLQELDTYIQENKHLPEIPTAEEVQENGISIGEMNAKLLQKIEELTLYVIELQKKNEEQDEIIKQLKNKTSE